MKSNVVRTLLDWALMASLVLSIVFLIQFFQRTRELRNLQGTLAVEAQKRQLNLALLNALATEASRYSERDPGMKQLLESIRPASAAATTNPTPQPVTR
jgi:hypothetical protein